MEEALPQVMQEYRELQARAIVPDYHVILHRHLELLQKITNRSTIVYISGWPHVQAVPDKGHLLGIERADADTIQLLVKGFDHKKGLDIILHSPGGNVAATKLIVDILRPAFHDVRAIIPQYAMSAAAMWACASNSLLMGKQSFLGPTDPQMKSDLTGTLASVSDILSDYDLISRDSQHGVSPLAFGFMLARYEPGLINKFKKVKELSRKFVEDSLRDYMFKDKHDAAAIAKIYAHWLCEE